MQRHMFHRPTSHWRSAPSSTEVSEARFKRFVKDLSGYERARMYEQTLDGFLDLYSTWLETGQPSLKLRLVMLAFELHHLDPSFKCELTFENPSCAKSL